MINLMQLNCGYSDLCRSEDDTEIWRASSPVLVNPQILPLSLLLLPPVLLAVRAQA
jgi:hypothetical protein